VRKVCSNCAIPIELTDEMKLWSKSKHAEKSEKRFFKASGCEKCQMTGYKGRIGIYQMINVDSELKRQILAGESESQLREYCSNQYNNSTLMDDGMLKASRGLTTIEELHRIIAGED
jgi:Type II secretory pathway, ATPase PulE/Tfp pilus assembly pathway, ATPase PilB